MCVAQGTREDLQAMREAIEKALSPYLTNPQRRVPNEQILILNGRTEIWRYESFESGDVDQKLCESARSLLFGRLPSNIGVRSLFVTESRLRDLSLILFRDQTRVRPDLSGRYVQSHHQLIVARLSISREFAFSLNEAEVKQRLSGPRCVEEAKRILSDLWISESILKRREALRVASIKVNAKKRAREAGGGSSEGFTTPTPRRME